ncbi:MAG: alpha/beta fold hydrolase [Planctomycetota bacterium]
MTAYTSSTTCSGIDLPGHGERADEARQSHAGAPGVIREAAGEIDGVLDAVHDAFGTVFDRDRTAIGGMSMGGMITLRRLCEPHRFVCAAIEGATGDLMRLYFPRADDPRGPWPVDHDRGDVESISAAPHLGGFAPVPLLALHSEADEMVPWPGQRDFLEELRERYRDAGADPALIEQVTWPETGAPFEHVGFGARSSEAKTIQTEFLRRHLNGEGGA